MWLLQPSQRTKPPLTIFLSSLLTDSSKTSEYRQEQRLKQNKLSLSRRVMLCATTISCRADTDTACSPSRLICPGLTVSAFSLPQLYYPGMVNPLLGAQTQHLFDYQALAQSLANQQQYAAVPQGTRPLSFPFCASNVDVGFFLNC